MKNKDQYVLLTDQREFDTKGNAAFSLIPHYFEISKPVGTTIIL